MTPNRRFPVIHDSRFELQTVKVPRSIPWEFAETFRAQAELNHNQTLERLVSRGGLSPVEMYAAAHGLTDRDIFHGKINKRVANEWLAGETAKV